MVKKSKGKKSEIDEEPVLQQEDQIDRPAQRPKFSFTDLADDGGKADDDEEDDFGGIMSVVRASKGKKKKELPLPQVDIEEKAAQEVAADDWYEEEEKLKKKKSKGQKSAQIGEDSPLTTEEVEAPRMLTKAEKEKAKKEREKAKKKAQAAAKKAASANLSEVTAEPLVSINSTAVPVPDNVETETHAEEAEGMETGDKKKKKKKKGGAKKEEDSAPAISAPKGGKPSAKISALRALMEQQQRAREEQLAREEEERRRIEEEEQRREEEERSREEAKQRKKEREKAKREELKKAGKLLTPKQKAEARALQQRAAVLMASANIEGLQSGTVDNSQKKKPVYGKRRHDKKAQKETQKEDSKGVNPVDNTPFTHTETVVVTSSAAKEDRVETSVVKGSHDAPSEEEVKDAWDASSESESEPDVEKASAAINPTTNRANGKVGEVPSEPTASQSTSLEPTASQSTSLEPTATTTNTKETSSSNSESEDDSDEDSSEDDSDESSDEEKLTTTQRQALKRKEEAAARRAKQHEVALAARSKDDLRSPICCVLGHVDTGKTKLLDKIRQTNVQEGEAGGITQQIGATYFPIESIKAKTSVLINDTTNYNIPGLLVIDTPGHESFTNLRSRGSSLCNIAVLVVDIMHGLEAQTLESIRLLKEKKTPFIVALNKIDRLYGWESTPNGGFQESLSKQKTSVKRLFDDGLKKVQLAFAEQGLNAVAYYENTNFARNVSLVPTSAISGEGIPDLLMLLCKLTTERMSDKLMYLSELECTVLEVKVVEGLGTTIDVVLSNGVLHVGDRIVLCGLSGAIATNVRQLLTPQPLKELRVKGQYVHHQEIKAAMGIKIGAPDLENAIAGSRLLVVGKDDDEDDLKDEVMADLAKLLNSIDRSRNGVCVQASTLGSLEALLSFLKDSKIPVSGVNIGPVYKKDVMRAATMLERAKEYAVMLCFDVVVDKDAEKLAEEMGVTIFTAKIIYHLFDAFTAYMSKIQEAKRADAAPKAVWPCRLRIIACFAKRDPIILGCEILEGSLRVGTPLCVVKVTENPDGTKRRETVSLGKVTSLEINHRSMQIVKQSQAGAGVAVKIEHASYETAKMYGRQFDDTDEVISMISRTSIDVLKSEFRDQVDRDDWLLIKKLKVPLGIP